MAVLSIALPYDPYDVRGCLALQVREERASFCLGIHANHANATRLFLGSGLVDHPKWLGTASLSSTETGLSLCDDARSWGFKTMSSRLSYVVVVGLPGHIYLCISALHCT